MARLLSTSCQPVQTFISTTINLRSQVSNFSYLRFFWNSRLAAAAAYARLHTSERFLEQMRLAREEFRVKTGLATIIEMKAWQKEQKKRAKAAAKAAKLAAR